MTHTPHTTTENNKTTDLLQDYQRERRRKERAIPTKQLTQVKLNENKK